MNSRKPSRLDCNWTRLFRVESQFISHLVLGMFFSFHHQTTYCWLSRCRTPRLILPLRHQRHQNPYRRHVTYLGRTIPMYWSRFPRKLADLRPGLLRDYPLIVFCFQIWSLNAYQDCVPTLRWAQKWLQRFFDRGFFFGPFLSSFRKWYHHLVT